MAPRAMDIINVVMAIGKPGFGQTIVDTTGKAAGRTANPGITVPVTQASLEIQRRQGIKDAKSPFSGFVPDEEEEGWWALAPLLWAGFHKADTDEGRNAAYWAALREFLGTSAQRYPRKD
jgi:hypothetical protein